MPSSVTRHTSWLDAVIPRTDPAQFEVRDQIANVKGAWVPQPFGGRYRQIQVYVDPLKLQALNMSLTDVSSSVNASNLILPAGDVRIGLQDFNIYANAQVPNPSEINSIPLRSIDNSSVLVGDVGHAVDGGAIQTNIVRINGQNSVYVPVLKQAGKSNTITIVDGMRAAVKGLVGIPAALKTSVVFDQSVFVKGAIKNLLKEAGIGLLLTGVMILVFLGSGRVTIAALIAIPLSVLTCLLIVNALGGSRNTMLLGGLALVLSRLIDIPSSFSRISSASWRKANRLRRPRVKEVRRSPCRYSRPPSPPQWCSSPCFCWTA